MGRYAVIKGNVVANVILWDGKTPWDPPKGCFAIEAPRGVGPGFIKQADGSFVAPPEPAPGPVELSVKDQLTALSAEISAIKAKLEEKEPK